MCRAVDELAVFLCLLVAITARVGAATPCVTSLDCALNGVCSAGACHCQPSWRGSPTCDSLAFRVGSSQQAYHNDTEASWGGNALFSASDGLWHAFVAQFENHCPLQDYGTNSFVAHLTSRQPGGPFTFQGVAVAPFAHNPTVRPLPTGGYIMFGIGGSPSVPKHCNTTGAGLDGDTAARTPHTSARRQSGIVTTGIFMATSDTLWGPWVVHRVNFTASSLNSWLARSFTNPSPHILPNGTIYLAFQAHPRNTSHAWELVGVARAPSWKGPYTIVTPTPVFPEHWYCVAGTSEDPFLWQDARGWHMLVHGMCPSGLFQAHYAASRDGIVWHPSRSQVYPYLVNFTDAPSRLFARVERPQLVFGSHDPATGFLDDPLFLFNGVCEDFSVCLFGAASGGKGAEGSSGMTWTLGRPLQQAG